MAHDHLSSVLDVVGVRGFMTGGVVGQGHWVSRSALHDPVKFFAVVSGRVLLATDGIEEPAAMGPGDVAVLSRRQWLELRSVNQDGPMSTPEPAPDFSAAHFAAADLATHDVVVGGCIDLDPAGSDLLTQALPPLLHLPATNPTGSRIHDALGRLFREASSGLPGAQFAVRQHGQLLMLEVLRATLAERELPDGWLRLLADEQLRPALELMHADPTRAWSLPDLARASAMSRTAFATRFRAVAGLPPVAYLSRWRMLLAQRALRADDARVGAVAAALGYGSESAFSTAFKREVGESPLHYRRRIRPARAG